LDGRDDDLVAFDVGTIKSDVESLNKTTADHTTALTSVNSEFRQIHNTIETIQTIQDSHQSVLTSHGTEIELIKSNIKTIDGDLNSKQDKLTAGENIEITYNEDTQQTVIRSTAQINNSWGGIVGNIEDQEDLMQELNSKIETSDEELNDNGISLQEQINDLKVQLQELKNLLNSK
jgi:chromosome segregation ATPase